MALTYNSLKNYLIKTAARPNDNVLVELLPQYIDFAQADLAARLNLQATKEIVQGTLLADSNFDLPPGLIRINSFNITVPALNNKLISLKRRTRDFVNSYLGNPESEGIPEFYTQNDVNTLIISPKPATADIAYLLDYQIVYVPLSDLVQENNLTKLYPHLLMYGAAIQMYVGMQPPSIETLQSLLGEGSKDANTDGQIGLTDQGQDASII